MNQFNQVDENFFRRIAEEELVKHFRMVVDRWIVPIQDNVYLYMVPEYVFDIRRLTYRGRQLNPYSGQEQIWSGSTPTRYSGGEPREYIYNYLGQKVIRLFPTPMETLPTTGDPWSGEVIREQCVLSFYRTPDFTDEFKRIPEWLRDQFTENFVIKELSKMDNQAFDTKTVQYFEARWQMDLNEMASVWGQLFKCVKSTIENFSVPIRQQPGRPQLPWQFGRTVI